MGSVQRAVALETRVHRRSQRPCRQQSPLDRIRRATLPKIRLDGVGQGLEQITVLPRADMKTGRQRRRFSRHATSKMPFDSGAAADREDDGPQAVTVMDQNSVLDEGPVCGVARSDQIWSGGIR